MTQPSKHSQLPRRPSMLTSLTHQQSLPNPTPTHTHTHTHTHNQNAYLLHAIEQYRSQAQINQQTEEEKQDGSDLEGVGIGGGAEEIWVEGYGRGGLRPLCCFKDLMELKKENMQKKQIVKKLQDLNQKLKQQYQNSLTNNKKMQSFLKQIEFTFKNDRQTHPKPHNPTQHPTQPHPPAHRANQTLMKATKTLHRQKHQSRKYIEKLTRNSKTNEMRELKCYVKVLEGERDRIGGLLEGEIEENLRRRAVEDFNQGELQFFQYCQNLLAQILQSGLRYTTHLRQTNKISKTTIKTHLTQTSTTHLKSHLAHTTTQIAQQLLKKQGLLYQIQLLKAKQKEKTKYSMKEEGCALREQIKGKRRRIGVLRQELREKGRSQEYLRKWTRELRGQLEQLKERHVCVKEEYQEEINKLSRQIQQWNRKYKAQLIEQQTNPKKYPPNQSVSPYTPYPYPYPFPYPQHSPSQPSNPSPNPTNPHFHTPPPQAPSTAKLVKLHQIDRLRKKVIFYAIENKADPLGYVTERLFGGSGSGNGSQGDGEGVSLRELYKGLMTLQVFADQQPTDIHKFARYIIQDPNTPTPPPQKIPPSLAHLILKNLLTSQLTHQKIPQIRTQLQSFLLNTFDQIRHETWLQSGKSSSFVMGNLRAAFGKYVKEEAVIREFGEYVEFLMWGRGGGAGGMGGGTGGGGIGGGTGGGSCGGEPYLLSCFQKVCEGLLGKKLVKDNSNRISKVNIRAIFDRLYDNNNSNTNLNLENNTDQFNVTDKAKADKDNCEEIQWNDYCKQQ